MRKRTKMDIYIHQRNTKSQRTLQVISGSEYQRPVDPQSSFTSQLPTISFFQSLEIRSLIAMVLPALSYNPWPSCMGRNFNFGIGSSKVACRQKLEPLTSQSSLMMSKSSLSQRR